MRVRRLSRRLFLNMAVVECPVAWGGGCGGGQVSPTQRRQDGVGLVRGSGEAGGGAGYRQ